MNVAHPTVRLARTWAFAVLLAGLGTAASSAPVSVFHDQASFLAATTKTATDTYDDLTAFTGLETPAPSTALPRTVGPYGYVATSLQVDTNPPNPLIDCFFTGVNPNDPTASDLWLGTNYQPDYVTIDTFTGGVSAIGGYFFATDIDNVPTMTALLITITHADHTTETFTELNPDPTTFLGFAGSDIVSLRIDNLEPGDFHASSSDGTFVTMNDLILAQTIPEPELAALFTLGAMAGVVIRRRRRLR